jgi:hypothetical protein
MVPSSPISVAMLASDQSEPMRFSSSGMSSDMRSSIEAITASSPRFTCVRPAFTTCSSGSGAASHSFTARSMLPA